VGQLSRRSSPAGVGNQSFGWRDHMSVAKITELSATSKKSFEDAIQKGIARANKSLRNVTGAWIKEQKLDISKGKITDYRVDMKVTFILDD
jgi:flavin-binding protein dodecin